MSTDLPAGYRWATESELDRPDAITVSRTVDSEGNAYTHGEADVAVPISKARPNSNYLLAVLRDGDIDHDPWGTAISMAFAVAECLTVLGAEVPAEMGFQPSPMVKTPTVAEFAETVAFESYDHMVVWEFLDAETGVWDVALLEKIEAVQFAGRCLHRYIEWCRKAGKDY